MSGPIFILAGEPSGDRLAASIMRALNGAFGRQQWIGVGGPAMKGEGLDCWIDMDELTVFGVSDAAKNYRRLSRLANGLVEQVAGAKPGLVLTVDAKGFSFRFAARLRRRMTAAGWSAPVIHTVAPTVWAWGEWRKKRLVDVLDGLLCLFPFEPDYFTPLGIDAKFIGHPEAFNPVYDKAGGAADGGVDGKAEAGGEAGAERGVEKGVRGKVKGNVKGKGKSAAPEAGRDDSGHVVILPGSRRSEIKYLLAPMIDAFALMRQNRPGLTASIPTLDRFAGEIRQAVRRRPGIVDAVDVSASQDALFKAFARGDAVLATSGTVTLQAALYGLPGVACYASSAISAFVGKRVVRMDRIILPNILLEREVYRFFFQERATPVAMAFGVLGVLDDAGARGRAAKSAGEIKHLLRAGAASFDENVVEAFAPWMTPQKRKR